LLRSRFRAVKNQGAEHERNWRPKQIAPKGVVIGMVQLHCLVVTRADSRGRPTASGPWSGKARSTHSRPMTWSCFPNIAANGLSMDQPRDHVPARRTEGSASFKRPDRQQDLGRSFTWNSPGRATLIIPALIIDVTAQIKLYYRKFNPWIGEPWEPGDIGTSRTRGPKAQRIADDHRPDGSSRDGAANGPKRARRIMSAPGRLTPRRSARAGALPISQCVPEPDGDRTRRMWVRRSFDSMAKALIVNFDGSHHRPGPPASRRDHPRGAP